MLPAIPFHFVRHGETDWNRQGRLQGWRDIPLNTTGEAQAEILRPSIAPLGFRSIAASPLLRARRTAEILNQGLALNIHFFDDLREFDVGPMEGDVGGGSWFPAWRAGDNPDGVESFAAFTRRVRRGMEAALTLPGLVLIVAHGGVVWALEHLLGLPVGLHIANTALVHFQPENARWRLELVSCRLSDA
jgi:broad specificity phosphatase PhoE